MKQVTIPQELVDEVNRDSPFPWTQYNHNNGLIQVGDANNKEVSIFLILKLAMTVAKQV